MSCCGEPNHKVENAQAAHQVTPFQTQPVSQQPGPQPSLNWQGSEKFQSPAGPSPPPQAYQNGYPSWEKSSPNGQTTFAPQGSPPPAGMYPNGAMPPHTPGSPPPGTAVSPYSAYSASIQSPPLARTSPGTVPMTVTSRGPSPPSMAQPLSFADEGKISVSIDFGESRRILGS